MDELFRKIFVQDNKWGIILGIIVAVFGTIFNYFLPSLEFISFIVQSIALFIITAMLSATANNRQRETIELATEQLLNKIEDKYENISCNSNHLFKIFHLNDGGSFSNVAHNIFFNKLIESYYHNGENRKYCISINTYYEIIKSFVEIGYNIKIINGILLPFWYIPKEKDEALKSYTEFCKNNTFFYDRVTYYQDYDGDEWKNNTVKMIFDDLLTSEKSDDVAVRWLITLISSIEELRNKFGNDIEKIINDELKKEFDYLHYHNVQFAAIIKNNIKNVIKFLEKEYDDTTVSCEMTAIINDLFFKDMQGKNKFVKKSIIDSRFAAEFNEDEINFEDVTEVGYYYKDDKEDYQFVMFLNGSNTGPSVEIEIITNKEKIGKIQKILSRLFYETENASGK
jgi:hypothetical protein